MRQMPEVQLVIPELRHRLGEHPQQVALAVPLRHAFLAVTLQGVHDLLRDARVATGILEAVTERMEGVLARFHAADRRREGLASTVLVPTTGAFATNPAILMTTSFDRAGNRPWAASGSSGRWRRHAGGSCPVYHTSVTHGVTDERKSLVISIAKTLERLVLSWAPFLLRYPLPFEKTTKFRDPCRRLVHGCGPLTRVAAAGWSSWSAWFHRASTQRPKAWARPRREQRTQPTEPRPRGGAQRARRPKRPSHFLRPEGDVARRDAARPLVWGR